MLGQFADLKGAWQEREGVVFEVGLTLMHTMTVFTIFQLSWWAPSKE